MGFGADSAFEIYKERNVEKETTESVALQKQLNAFEIYKKKDDEINALKEQIKNMQNENEKLKQQNNEDWDRYDDLKLSDDEQDDDKKGASLFAPAANLKSKGSVVDMLMDGPSNTEK